MVDTCTMQPSFGLGPRGPPDHPHGAQQGPSGAPGAPRPEEQHHKPFFYIQPSQPYLPLQGLQWSVPVPVPVSYSPYYGYPGESEAFLEFRTSSCSNLSVATYASVSLECLMLKY